MGSDNRSKAVTTSGGAGKEYEKRLSATLRWPLIFGTWVVTYFVGTAAKWQVFTLHVFFMLVGYVALTGNAILFKKIGGAANTRMHGYLMGATVVCAFFGMWAIYQHKETSGYPHLMTWHSWLGTLVFTSSIGSLVVAYYCLDVDTGKYKTNQTIRAVHKYGGRATTALALFTSILGWRSFAMKMASIKGSEKWRDDLAPQALFAVPLVLVFVPLILF